ncbi:hypothetical protein [Macrococcoides caseolyticum]|uniref:Uncharacterized protein n=1 Tax=Macrococcoides caseolyticum TaxID=69966 RepID=A0A855GJS6_9STAP|nr:hypothetical protein [Macrococcus caseolyticus]PKE26174.1 hypothetical protein CW686_06605 [Macrococcus caseolyticus]PKE58688.1 hypothetical protein CW673_06725 [Macrococcus caseolyticus]
MDINSIKTKDSFHNYVTIKQSDNTSPIEVLLCDSKGMLLSSLNEDCTVSIYDAVSKEVRQISNEKIINGVLSFIIINDLFPYTHKLEITTQSGAKFPADDDFQIFVSESHDSKLLNIIKSVPTELALQVVTNKVMERFNSIYNVFKDYTKKGEILLSDINWNFKKIDTEHLSDNLIKAISGNAAVSAVIPEKSVTSNKLYFTVPKKNLFNPNTITKGVVLNTVDGTLKSDVSYAYVTDHILVEPNEWYAINKYITNISIYDGTGAFIKSVIQATSNSNIIEQMPSNARTIRGTVYNAGLTTAQVEKGKIVTPYEPYTALIKSDYVEKTPLTQSDIPKISIEKLDFTNVVSKNLIDVKNVVDNALLNAEGLTSTDSRFQTSQFFDVSMALTFTATNVYIVAWYDAKGHYISQIVSPQVGITKPSNATQARVSYYKTNAATVQFEIGSIRTSHDNYAKKISRDYLDLPSGNVSGGGSSTGLITGFNVTDMAQAEENARKLIPNVDQALNIPTYDGSNSATHPSVLYFKNGWNGYKFWMAMTPYPNANNKFENPSIVASNDNVTWDEPPTNPVNPIAPLAEGDNYNSDPCLLMKGNTMEMWYRVSRLATETTWHPREFYRMTSTDGKNWTPKELMFTGATVEEEILSQTIRYIDGKYKMWYVLTKKPEIPVIKYTESIDGKTWSPPRKLNITMPDPAYTFWHGDVIVDDDGSIQMIMMCKSTTKRWATFYMYSQDNVNFTTPTLIIKPSVPLANKWDSMDLYRPALVKVEDEYYVYYTTPYKIGLTKGKTLLTLGVSNNKLDTFTDLYEIKRYMAGMNKFLATDTFDKYPPNAITEQMVWSTEDKGWPELSGTVITRNVYREYDKSQQVFYTSTKSNYYYMRNATSVGWTAWYKYSGNPT